MPRDGGDLRGQACVPLEVDPARRHVIGLVLEPGRTDVCRLGLGGTLLERVHVRQVGDPARLIPTAAALLGRHRDARTLGVGVSVTGFVDVQERTLLFSSAMKGGPAADLSPIFDAAGDLPVVLENDMHALASRWLLTHRADHQQDVLLVWIEDGRMGAAILVNGRPNRGLRYRRETILATRDFLSRPSDVSADTPAASSRIVSTPFLVQVDRASNGKALHPSLSLLERAARFEATGQDPAMDEMLKYLSCGLAKRAQLRSPASAGARQPVHASAGVCRCAGAVDAARRFFRRWWIAFVLTCGMSPAPAQPKPRLGWRWRNCFTADGISRKRRLRRWDSYVAWASRPCF